MNIFNALFRAGSRKAAYSDLLRLDDHLLRDIGLSRGDVRTLLAGRRDRAHRTHE